MAFNSIRDKVELDFIRKGIEELGSIEKVWGASIYDVLDFGWSVSYVNDHMEAVSEVDIERFKHLYQRMDENNIGVIPYNDTNYPTKLLKIHSSEYQPPFVLFIKGKLREYEKSIALVGNRDASHFAISSARNIAKHFASKGYAIISGLARGIDRESHLGALDVENGITVAVLAWLNPVYPNEHTELSKTIATNGAVISELYQSPTNQARSRYARSRFVYRNRIISGLSDFIIAVESGPTGGTIWQTQLALEQNKRVYTLEPIDKNNKDKMMGFNKMVSLGAKPISSIEDLSTLKVY